VKDLSDPQITSNLDKFLRHRNALARYSSFDYCYNYFRSFFIDEKTSTLGDEENSQNSCLQLGFYLASWGMYRGSAPILQTSVASLKPVIDVVAAASPELWNLDVPGYDDEKVDKLVNNLEEIRKAFSHKVSNTLVTKVALGVFGNIPAFDRYFIEGSGLRRPLRKNLLELRKFYFRHNEIIDAQQIETFDFVPSVKTKNIYPIAKKLDMIFFVEGAR